MIMVDHFDGRGFVFEGAGVSKLVENVSEEILKLNTV